MQPLHIRASTRAVHDAILHWMAMQPQSSLLSPADDDSYVHARFLSLFWGFADDFMVGLRCDGSQRTIVEVQVGR